MSRRMICVLFGAALFALSHPAGSRALPATLTPADSTSLDAWRLPNGMEARALSIPGSVGVSVSIAYAAGSLDLPAERPGLARLLAELQFTAAAGDVPERSRDDLGTQRPAGWDLRVTDHVAVLTEVATRAQFPGVLLQVAARAGGVKLSDACLQSGLVTVRRTLAEGALGAPDLVLHRRVRDLALGIDDATTIANAGGRGFSKLTRAEASELLARYYAPANGAMALVGDFSNLDLRALVDGMFAKLPGGTPASERPSPALVAGERTSIMQGLRTNVSAIATFSPALDDTLHPVYYLASLIAGGWWHEHEGAPSPPLSSSFRYSPLDEPDLARFFLPTTPGADDARSAQGIWMESMDVLRGQAFTDDIMLSVRGSVDWLIGGPVPAGIRTLSHQQVAPLTTLSVSMATRARWRGDAFWDLYRHRFMQGRIGPLMMLDWMVDPRHVATLTLTPHP